MNYEMDVAHLPCFRRHCNSDCSRRKVCAGEIVRTASAGGGMSPEQKGPPFLLDGDETAIEDVALVRNCNDIISIVGRIPDHGADIAARPVFSHGRAA